MEPRILRKGDWTSVDPTQAGWRFVSFGVEQLQAGDAKAIAADGLERAVVPLSGRVRLELDGSRWEFGGRDGVFDGVGDCMYIPAGVEGQLTAVTDSEFAVAAAPAQASYEPHLVRAGEGSVVVRGAGTASRQVSTPIPPDFPADRLLVVEVWTPGGNWSSFPPHKHEVDRDGEAELEETYYYRLRDPENGWAIQRIYGPEQGFELVETVRDGDLCVINWGFHTTVAAHGHDLYYMNVLAGPAPERTLQAFVDPSLVGLRDSWPDLQTDSRLPLVK